MPGAWPVTRWFALQGITPRPDIIALRPLHIRIRRRGAAFRAGRRSLQSGAIVPALATDRIAVVRENMANGATMRAGVQRDQAGINNKFTQQAECNDGNEV